MHGHGSTRAERVRSSVFWCQSKSGCPDSNDISPEDCDDAQGADRAEPVVGVRVVADMGGSQAPMFMLAEKNVDTCSNRAGCCRLVSEVRD